MGTFIFILILILILAVFVAVIMIVSNRKLKKELKEVKETVGKIQSKEKEYAKIKESFDDTDDGGDNIVGFLSNHKRSNN